MNGDVHSLAGAHAIEQRSEAIARGAVDGLPPIQRTLAARVLAARFIQNCVTAAAQNDWSTLPQWADAACERYADIMPAARVLDVAADGVMRALEAQSAQCAGTFAGVRPSLDAILARPRVRRLSHVPEVVDEIDVVVDALLLKLDESDVLTAEHSRAVSSWSLRLGVRLGYGRDEITELRRAGMVHDIGKVMTPNEILMAPRALSEREMSIMRDHTLMGVHILSEVPLIAHLTPAVRNHHERIDGRGYPDAMRGEQIPRIARVVSVADAFNAMIGRRPYRDPIAPSVALERLVEGRGTQFDPDVVDAMVDVVQPNPI